MSATLLQAIKAHIIDDGELLDGYAVRYYRWRDSDLAGTLPVVLFRRSGTGGTSDHEVQFPDVSIQIVVDPAAVVTGDSDMTAVVRYCRANYTTSGVFNIQPLGEMTGPTYLQNGRAMFEIVLRCGVTETSA